MRSSPGDLADRHGSEELAVVRADLLGDQADFLLRVRIGVAHLDPGIVALLGLRLDRGDGARDGDRTGHQQAGSRRSIHHHLALSHLNSIRVRTGRLSGMPSAGPKPSSAVVSPWRTRAKVSVPPKPGHQPR